MPARVSAIFAAMDPRPRIATFILASLTSLLLLMNPPSSDQIADSAIIQTLSTQLYTFGLEIGESLLR